MCCKFENILIPMQKHKINIALLYQISELNWAITLILIIGLIVSLLKGG
jgi:hypothetical protein